MSKKAKTPSRTFTIPLEDSERIVEVQRRCRLNLDLPVLNDGEVVRAGIAALSELPDKKFKEVVKAVERLRRGRQPKQD